MTLEKINEIVKNFLVEDLEIDEEKICGTARLKEDLGIDSLEVVDVVVEVVMEVVVVDVVVEVVVEVVVVEVVVDVDDQFGYKMKPEDFRTLITLDDFCHFIQDHVE